MDRKAEKSAEITAIGQLVGLASTGKIQRKGMNAGCTQPALAAQVLGDG